jgi:hypothetical protein
MPVVFVQCSSFFIELLHELRAVVGKNRVKRVSKTLGDDATIWRPKAWVGRPQQKQYESVINQADDVTPDSIETTPVSSLTTGRSL